MTQIELETMSAVKNAARKYAQEGIDREQRRYEIAKAVLPLMIESWEGFKYWQLCKVKAPAAAIDIADELIKQLKGGEQ